MYVVYVCSINVQHDTDFREPESLDRKEDCRFLRGWWLGSGRWPAELWHTLGQVIPVKKIQKLMQFAQFFCK